MSGSPSPGFDLLVLGELNADLLLYGDVVPSFGQAEQLVEDAELTVGSSSAIFAHQAARLELRVGFVGRVGDDLLGGYLKEALVRGGIDTSAVVADPTLKTGLTVHLVNGEDRAMLTHPGAMTELRAEDVDPDLLRRARHVHVGSYFLQTGLQAGLPELFARARETGVTTSLDPGWDPAERWNSRLGDVLAATDVFLPNEQELLQITGASSVEEALKELSAVPTVVAKLGATGALARSGGTTARCTPPQVVPVDATGAGDSFGAGFVFGLLRGYGLEQALSIGCFCGARSTARAGGVESQPDLSELETLLSQTGTSSEGGSS